MKRCLVAAIACLLACCDVVLGQGVGIPNSPANKAFIDNPLNTTVFRLAPPIIARGPANDFCDEPITFVPNVSGPGFTVFCSNQAGWYTTTTSSDTTQGYSGSNIRNPANTAACSPQNAVTVPGTSAVFCSPFTLLVTPGIITPIAPLNSSDVCGDWVMASYLNPYDNRYYLLVHNEGPCNYGGSTPDTKESSSVWKETAIGARTFANITTSASNGTVESTDNPLTPSWIVGAGDCTWEPDSKTAPVWMYMVCGHYSSSAVSDYKTVMFRAPIRNLGPGNWTGLYNGCYCQPALLWPFNLTSQRPQLDLLPWVGSGLAGEPGTPFALMTLAWGHVVQPVNDPVSNGESISGFTLSVAANPANPKWLTSLWPILNYDIQQFTPRPTNTDGYFYEVFRNDIDGSSVLNPNHFNLWTMWTPPNGDLYNRYEVAMPITVSHVTLGQAKAGYPLVGITLETWINSGLSNRLRTTTVNPFASSTNGATETGWAKSASLGYMITRCPAGALVNKCDSNGALVGNQIEECWNGASGSPANDYQLHIDTAGTTHSCPSGYTGIARTSGWLYKAPQTTFATKPVESCANTSTGYHYASNDVTCGGQTVVGLLGYALAN